MNTDFLATKIQNAMGNVLGSERVARVGLKSLIIPALLVVAAMSFSGCAGDYYAAGYGAAYYAPDYGPYYADYGLCGLSLLGPGPVLRWRDYCRWSASPRLLRWTSFRA
jgi:hypothetical protein